MENKYVLLIVLGIIIVAIAGYFLIKTPSIENKTLPLQGILGMTNSDETQIREIISERFFSHPQLGGEISAHCNASNTRINLLANVIAKGDSSDLIGANVECNCGIDCGYSITYELKKVSGNWVIESESQMSLV